MDVAPSLRAHRGRGDGTHRPQSRNKHWTPSHASTSVPNLRTDTDKWERGGHRGGRGRGLSTRGAPGGVSRKFPNRVLNVTADPPHIPNGDAIESDQDEPVLETQEERERFYQDLVKAREIERKKAIAEGKMDDPLVPKRLEDAITLVGTCMQMCPRFERYRRERENNLTEWETIPGTKRVDHKRAVKMYERAAGDKTLPSDLRPPGVLKSTLDYLFHDLLPRGGFHRTFSFIRDRSRAVRNDFTMQHETGPLAMECHERCARFHILALHFERDEPDFSIAMEEQQLMYALQSLKEFYGDQRNKYQSPNELEMRVYHRLIHIRDQRERHDDIPAHITSHPVFELTTEFRLHVQKKSAPISKTSKLTVDGAAMEIFGRLAGVLREQGSVVMIYLVACILERLFGKDAIDDIESIRGDLETPDIIDGMAVPHVSDAEEAFLSSTEDDLMDNQMEEEPLELTPEHPSNPLRLSPTEWLNANILQGPPSTAPNAPPPTHASALPTTTNPPAPLVSAFAGLTSKPNPFGTQSVFGAPSPASTGTPSPPKSVFGSVFKATVPFPSPPTQPPLPPLTFGLGNVHSAAPETPVPHPEPILPVAFPSIQPQKASLQSQPTIPDIASATQPIASTSTLDATAPVFVPSLRTAGPLSSNDEPVAPVASTSTIPSFTSTPFAGATPSKSLLSPLPVWTPPTSSSIAQASTPPTLPKLNTGAVAYSNSDEMMSSPYIPPALGRKQPISLPPTPTIAPPAAWPHLGFLRNGTLTPTSSMNSDILSPLVLSPSASRSGSMFDVSILGTPGTPSSSKIEPKAAPSPPPAALPKIPPLSVKGKERAHFDKDVSQEKATSFRGNRLLTQCFRRWSERSKAKAALADAWKKSESYRAKIEAEKQNGASLANKRRRTLGADVIPEALPPKKRPKRRASDKYQTPRTDEDLAKRLKENQEEHERRWARGSFLHTVITHFRTLARARNSQVLPSWRIWVSLNPESDATAIWLERKFDIPASGTWFSETIFEIPISKESETDKSGYPGLIIFECTPLDSIPDEIERKYRILDDCTRMRDLLESLPQERHFVPSLLVLSWSSNHQSSDLGPDFQDMINSSLRSNTIKSYSVFSFASDTKDLDTKFARSLEPLECDLDGELVQTLSIRHIFGLFDAPLRHFVNDNLDRCFAHLEFKWTSYSAFLTEYVLLMNDLAQAVLGLAGSARHIKSLPPFQCTEVETQSDADLYTATLSWLSQDISPMTQNIISDLQSHRSMARDFPSTAFLDHLTELTRHLAESACESQSSTFHVPKKDARVAVASFTSLVETRSKAFMERAASHWRMSQRRRSVSLISDDFQPPSKRGRLSTSVSETPSASTFVNGFHSVVSASPSTSARSSPFSTAAPDPSPTKSLINGHINGSANNDTNTKTPPNVTLAMLKALTKDVKTKYGSAK